MVIEILHVANSKWTKINLNLGCINISIKICCQINISFVKGDIYYTVTMIQ